MALMFSGDQGVVTALRGFGITPQYGMGPWIGPWTNQAQIDNHIAWCKTNSVTPGFQFFYWGDELCLEAIKGTVQPRELGTGVVETVGTYWALVKLLTDRLKATETIGALVSLESEWNKLGQKAPAGTHSIMDEPAVFDKLFADTAGLLHSAGAKVVTCPGSWGGSLAVQLAKFPLMVAATDYVATQGLNTTLNQTAAPYIASADRFLARMGELKIGGKGKPILVMDCAWSSYAGSHLNSGSPPQADHYAPIPPATVDSNLRAGEDLQRQAIERLGVLLPQLEAAGLKGLFYRGLKDSKMALGNYWGYFEWGWGVVRSDGSKKPAYDALMALAKPVPPPPPPDPCADLKVALVASQQALAAAVASRDAAVAATGALEAERLRLAGKIAAARTALA